MENNGLYLFLSSRPKVAGRETVRPPIVYKIWAGWLVEMTARTINFDVVNEEEQVN